MESLGFIASVGVLAASGAASAQPVEPAPPEPSVMIVEFPHGVPAIGLPRHCPGSAPDSDPEEAICFAELYQGRFRTVRHLSGPKVARGTKLRLTAHARRWGRGTRMLVAAQPFQDGEVGGYFAYWWDLPEENGAFCVASDDLAEWEDDPVRRAYAAGSRRRFRPRGYSEATEFHCIRGPSANR